MSTGSNINVKKSKCPLTMSLGVIGGKWKPLIIYNLNRSTKRFGQLDATIPSISRKVLTDQLNQLVKDQLVIRTAFAETPPRVEYCLSPKGKELVPILKAIAKWGNYLVEI
jgi:DNA-binding HxlR family transcriptional regulator